MKNQIEEVIAQGYKPVVFIASDLAKSGAMNGELLKLSRQAKHLNIPVIYDSDLSKLNRMVKAHVFRYGYIPTTTEAMIKRKKGKIVSGNLKLIN